VLRCWPWSLERGPDSALGGFEGGPTSLCFRMCQPRGTGCKMTIAYLFLPFIFIFIELHHCLIERLMKRILGWPPSKQHHCMPSRIDKKNWKNRVLFTSNPQLRNGYPSSSPTEEGKIERIKKKLAVALCLSVSCLAYEIANLESNYLLYMVLMKHSRPIVQKS